MHRQVGLAVPGYIAVIFIRLCQEPLALALRISSGFMVLGVVAGAAGRGKRQSLPSAAGAWVSCCPLWLHGPIQGQLWGLCVLGSFPLLHVLLTNLALKRIVLMILGNCLHRMPVPAAGGEPSVLPQSMCCCQH